MVQVPDVDAEEVREPDDRSRGNADPSFGDLAEEVGKGGEGPPVARMAEAAIASSTRMAP